MNVPYMKYLPIKTRTGDKSVRKHFSDVCFAIKTLKFLALESLTPFWAWPLLLRLEELLYKNC